MKSLTLNKKRFVVGIWLAMFVFALGNEYLEWGIFGNSAKLVRSAVMLVGILALVRFGPKMFGEMDRHTAAKREADETIERARDKSNDAGDSNRLRRSIGMPLSASQETDAQQTIPADRPKTGSG